MMEGGGEAPTASITIDNLPNITAREDDVVEEKLEELRLERKEARKAKDEQAYMNNAFETIIELYRFRNLDTAQRELKDMFKALGEYRRV
jgi:hypothetical protein